MGGGREGKQGRRLQVDPRMGIDTGMITQRMDDPKDTVAGEKSVTSSNDPVSSEASRNAWWVRFLPAILTYQAWVYIMAKQDWWADAFTQYYPLSLAMVA